MGWKQEKAGCARCEQRAGATRSAALLGGAGRRWPSLSGLAGCSAETIGELKRLGLPEAGSDRAPCIVDLWIGTWIAAGVDRRRRLGADHLGGAALPDQPQRHARGRTRYNLPMEIFYTVAPFVVIGVLFYYTVLAQNVVHEEAPEPDLTVDVVGQKWSWTFNYK